MSIYIIMSFVRVRDVPSSSTSSCTVSVVPSLACQNAPMQINFPRKHQQRMHKVGDAVESTGTEARK